MIWPFRHLGLKVLSVALAVLLWMVLAGEEIVERGLRVPLEMQQVPADLELVGEAPTVVDVRVRGGSGTLGRLSPGDIVAVLNLAGTKPGRRLFQLAPEQVRTPFGVDVVQVVPSSLAMMFETVATRHLPVAAPVEGAPAPGYVVGTVTTTPTSVEVVGPESAVARATEAVTETVSVAGAREAVTENVTVGLLDPSLRLKNTSIATVRVEIRPAPHERTLAGQPVHLRNLEPKFTAQAVPAAVDVVLRGSRDGLGRVGASDISVYVDLAGLGPGEYPLPVRLNDIPDAGVMRIVPETVQVRIVR
jgi:YbbR domain-containing protein